MGADNGCCKSGPVAGPPLPGSSSLACDLLSDASGGPCELTIATSALNEADNVVQFCEEALQALAHLAVDGEVLFIDDGSSDGTASVVAHYAKKRKEARIRVLQHGRPRGLAAAINEAAQLAQGRFICFLPADLECSPLEDVPKLYAAAAEGIDAVLGQRVGRDDRKTFASGLYNRLNRRLFGVEFRDANWIKLVRRERLRSLRLKRDWHPFLAPMLAHQGCRIATVDCRWRPRRYGRSKFGWKRIPVGLVNALAVKLHLHYAGRPLPLFLRLAAVAGAAGAVLLMAAWSVDPLRERTSMTLYCLAGSCIVAAWASGLAGLAAELLADPRAGEP